MEEVKKEIETLEEATQIIKNAKDDTIEDCFEILVKEKDKEIRVFNTYGGCIVNTYVKGAVASIFVPQMHIKNGQLTTM